MRRECCAHAGALTPGPGGASARAARRCWARRCGPGAAVASRSSSWRLPRRPLPWRPRLRARPRAAPARGCRCCSCTRRCGAPRPDARTPRAPCRASAAASAQHGAARASSALACARCRHGIGASGHRPVLQAGGSGQELCGGREDGGCAAETQARRLCRAQVHMFCCALALTFVAMPFPAWTALWAGSLFIYYSLTAYGAPEHTGASRVSASRSCETPSALRPARDALRRRNQLRPGTEPAVQPAPHFEKV